MDNSLCACENRVSSLEQTIALMSDQMVLMERRIRQGEDDGVEDVLDMPIDFREYMLVPSVPVALVVSERVLDMERVFKEDLVPIEDQMVNGVPFETWARSEATVEVWDWTRADLLELEEWDRIHTLPLVSFVCDDSPEEVEIGMWKRVSWRTWYLGVWMLGQECLSFLRHCTPLWR